MAADFDPFGDGYQQDPPDYLRWAREKEPIFWSPKLGYWVVTRYEDIKEIFRDNITFSPSIALEKITPTGPEANAVLASYGFALNRTLVNEDEPAHMPRRRALMEPFTPEELRHHEPLVRQLTREYVDRFIDDGGADLVDQMLWEIPLTVALHFLGVPSEDMDTLRKYSIAHTVNTWGRPKPEEQVAVAHAVGNFWQFAGKVLNKMRLNPEAAGWMQYGLRRQKEMPEIITDSYLHSMMMAGIVAAHETTANATANALKLLLQNRNAWLDICNNPSLIPNAVEECLRHNGSVAAWRRLATTDCQVNGHELPAGSKLLIVTSSANHDNSNFPDGDLFDIRRENASDHLTFGYGSHQCMGRGLARMEMQIFIEELSRRLPHMQLAPQTFTYVPNTSFRGPEHLIVSWDPKLNPERTTTEIRNPTKPFAVSIQDRPKASRTRIAIVEEITKVADDVIKIRLTDPGTRPMPRWIAGSHIDIECGSSKISRQYSLCGDPSDSAALEIAILRERSGRGGSNWAHSSLKPGDELKIRGPRNHFQIDESAKKLIFVAGGIGITPIMAMAREAKARGAIYEIHYSGRKRTAMPFLDDLTSIHGEKLKVYVSEEGSRNNVSDLLSQPDDETQIYACGPIRMLDALQSCCSKWPENALHFEHFVSTQKELDASTEHDFEVELKNSGVTILVPANQTLLSSLRQANIEVQSDCEEGLCGSCEVSVLSGEVDHRDLVLSQSEKQANDRMMVCCSRACGTRLVLDL